MGMLHGTAKVDDLPSGDVATVVDHSHVHGQEVNEVVIIATFSYLDDYNVHINYPLP